MLRKAPWAQRIVKANNGADNTSTRKPKHTSVGCGTGVSNCGGEQEAEELNRATTSKTTNAATSKTTSKTTNATTSKTTSKTTNTATSKTTKDASAPSLVGAASTKANDARQIPKSWMELDAGSPQESNHSATWQIPKSSMELEAGSPQESNHSAVHAVSESLMELEGGGQKKFLPDRINKANCYMQECIIHSDTLGCTISSARPPKSLMPNTKNECCSLSEVPKNSDGHLQGLRQHDWFCRNDFSGFSRMTKLLA